MMDPCRQRSQNIFDLIISSFPKILFFLTKEAEVKASKDALNIFSEFRSFSLFD